MTWISNNLAESLIIIGLVLLVIEIVVLGFSTFVLFFVGLAMLITGGLLYLGILPDSMLSALYSIGVFTALMAIFLWRPLKSMQGKVKTKKVTNDMVGHSFILNEAVSASRNPVYRYSGIDWNLSSEEELSAGTSAEVIDVEVGKLVVKAKTE
jgi:membrane protein implicated in regulation of membrane protease activity